MDNDEKITPWKENGTDSLLYFQELAGEEGHVTLDFINRERVAFRLKRVLGPFLIGYRRMYTGLVPIWLPCIIPASSIQMISPAK